MTAHPQGPGQGPRQKKALPSGSRDPKHVRAAAEKFTPRAQVLNWDHWRDQLVELVLSTDRYPSVDTAIRQMAASAHLLATTCPSLDTPLDKVFSEDAIAATVSARSHLLSPKSMGYLRTHLRLQRNLALGLGTPAGTVVAPPAPPAPPAATPLETLRKLAPTAPSGVRQSLLRVLEALESPTATRRKLPVTPSEWGRVRKWVSKETDFLALHGQIRAMEWRNLQKWSLVPLLSQETSFADLLTDVDISHSRLDSIVRMLRLEPERAQLTRATSSNAA